jgi:hypothetical protein
MDFSKYLCFHRFMNAELQISIKDCHRKRDAVAGPVSLTRPVPALRQTLVKAGRAGG